jgi:L-lactate dehydrogenase (cytochrome)
LPGIVQAIGSEIPVLADGGVRSGLDIVKLLCLGASAVLIGRAWAYGLAADGEAGVDSALEILRKEMCAAMALMGCVNLRALSSDCLVRLP